MLHLNNHDVPAFRLQLMDRVLQSLHVASGAMSFEAPP